MATWKHTEITIDGRFVKAQAPIIISASRSTDIPAFYADWFFDRLEKGYSAWTNPFNGVKSYVSSKENDSSKQTGAFKRRIEYLSSQN